MDPCWQEGHWKRGQREEQRAVCKDKTVREREGGGREEGERKEYMYM